MRPLLQRPELHLLPHRAYQRNGTLRRDQGHRSTHLQRRLLLRRDDALSIIIPQQKQHNLQGPQTLKRYGRQRRNR